MWPLLEASELEYRFCKPLVGGSNLSPGTKSDQALKPRSPRCQNRLNPFGFTAGCTSRLEWHLPPHGRLTVAFWGVDGGRLDPSAYPRRALCDAATSANATCQIGAVSSADNRAQCPLSGVKPTCCNVRYSPKSRHRQPPSSCPLCAKSGHSWKLIARRLHVLFDDRFSAWRDTGHGGSLACARASHRRALSSACFHLNRPST